MNTLSAAGNILAAPLQTVGRAALENPRAAEWVIAAGVLHGLRRSGK